MEITDYPNYLIYDDGRVQNKKTKRFLKPNKDNNGYLKLVLCQNKKPKTFRIHRLVALHYIPLVEGKTEVDHIDRDKTNNNISNLRWCNKSENQRNTGARRNNKLGIKHIQKRNNIYRVAINTKSVKCDKTFKTLEEAIEYRDEYLSTIS